MDSSDKDNTKHFFTEQHMEEAFEAGRDLEAWYNRGTDPKNKPPVFDEWIEEYKDQIND